MSDLRTAAQQALEALEYRDGDGADQWKADVITALRDALAEPPTNQCGETCERAKLCAVCARGLAEPQQDPELSAALGWVGGISEPLLDRKALLRRVAEIATDSQAKTKRAWDVGYDCGIRAAKEFAAERRLTDAEIGQLWFEAKLPGVTETQARLLIRAAEAKIKDNYE